MIGWVSDKNWKRIDTHLHRIQFSTHFLMLTMVETIDAIDLLDDNSCRWVGLMLSLSFLCKRQSYREQKQIEIALIWVFWECRRNVVWISQHQFCLGLECANVTFPPTMVPIRNGSFHLHPSTKVALQEQIISATADVVISRKLLDVLGDGVAWMMRQKT